MAVSYLQVEGLTKSYGDKFLFADISFGVCQGEKIGLIAQNGKGKSTLLSILAGEEDYDSGDIIFRNGIRVGYLNQTPYFDNEKNILENVLPKKESDDDWTREDRAKQMLHQLEITDFSAYPTTMSGGQLKRAAIARVLLEQPDMLILDEPTNHLDIRMVEWLENYLSTQKTTLLMVTHDRYFLDNVCNKILEIDRQNVYEYAGNYDYYLEKTCRENGESVS